MAERHRQRGALARRVPGDVLGIDGGSVQEDGRPRRVHRLREGDLQVTSQGDGLLTVGKRRIVEGRTGDLGGGFRAKRDRIVLAPESDPLAGSDHLDPVCRVGRQLRMEFEAPRTLDDHRVGHCGNDVKASGDRRHIHVLVESERDGRAPNHGVVPVSDAGTDRQRCGERAEHQRGRHQQQDDGENPPATLQHRGQPVVAGQGLAHQGILSRVLRPAAQAISRTIRNQLQRLSGLLSALANGFLGGEPPYARITPPSSAARAVAGNRRGRPARAPGHASRCG